MHRLAWNNQCKQTKKLSSRRLEVGRGGGRGVARLHRDERGDGEQRGQREREGDRGGGIAVRAARGDAVQTRGRVRGLRRTMTK